jgi:ribonuclease T2
LTAPAALAKKHRKHKAKFDYYLLALSWAPTFCAEHPSDHSSECKIGANKTFVLHGLWPQADNGAPPMSCGAPGTIPKAVVDRMLEFMPTRGLIRHEWEKHGTCSGLSASDYFDQAEKAFKDVRVPDAYLHLTSQQTLKVDDLERSFASVNHAPQGSIRSSCSGAKLSGLEICLTKDLQYRACTTSVRECSSSQVRLPAPK